MRHHLFFITLFSTVIIWYRELRYREIAQKIAKRVCLEQEIQFLDQTVARAATRIQWSGLRPVIVRIYRFDFSINGDDRKSGKIALIAGKVAWAEIAERKLWYH